MTRCKDVVVAPGETKDLGDLKVQPPRRRKSDHLSPLTPLNATSPGAPLVRDEPDADAG
ncbi:hypothetical protein ACYOEI_04430 [Singulisphaera rosea]